MLDTTQETIQGGRRQRGGRQAETPPVRRCIATGDSKPLDRLVRFAVSPENRVVPDVAGNLPGRGIWVTADRASVDLARAKGLFSRAARRSVTADPALADQVECQLAQRCVDLLGLARRGGGAVAGYDKVRSFILADHAGLLLAAADAGEDGRRKTRQLGRDLAVIDALDRFELGRAFGRTQAVHAAVAPGRLARGLEAEARRLIGFRQRTVERGA